MMVLWEEDTINVKELGKKLFLDSGTLTPVLKRLEQKMLIERNLIVSLTKEGEGLLLKRRALELANWFGKDFGKLNIAFTSNLGTNAGVMAMNGLGYPVSVEGAGRYWRKDLLVQKRLYPKIETSTVIAWRRNIPYSPAVRKFIELIQNNKD